MGFPRIEDLESVKITNKKQAEKYLNKSIYFLRNIDIDKSGRGYYFVRFLGQIIKVENKEFVSINNDRIQYKDIKYIKIKNRI